MSAFYASKVEEIAAAGESHNDAMRELYPSHDDRRRALNLNIKLALVGDSQVPNSIRFLPLCMSCIKSAAPPSVVRRSSKEIAAPAAVLQAFLGGFCSNMPLLTFRAKSRKLALTQDPSNGDCDGTADGETYARMRRCLQSPNYNVFSNNNRCVATALDAWKSLFG